MTLRPGHGSPASSERSAALIVDTWRQTETGGILITPLPGATFKPGSLTRPFFGVRPEIRRCRRQGSARSLQPETSA